MSSVRISRCFGLLTLLLAIGYLPAVFAQTAAARTQEAQALVEKCQSVPESRSRDACIRVCQNVVRYPESRDRLIEMLTTNNGVSRETAAAAWEKSYASELESCRYQSLQAFKVRPQPVNEVIMFTSLLCAPCKEAQERAENWGKSQTEKSLRIIPVLWGTNKGADTAIYAKVELLAQSYGDATIANNLRNLARNTFQTKPIKDEGEIPAFAVEAGADPESVDKILSSFGFSRLADQVRKLNNDYRPNSVPSYVVGGEFTSNPIQ